MNVKGKNIIITGGSLGIGKETARDLVKKGANVLITGRSEIRLIEAKNYTGFEPVTSALSRQRSKPTELITLFQGLKDTNHFNEFS